MTEKQKKNSNSFALITGATHGIGHELAKLFASNGTDVILTARNKKRLEEICQDLRTNYAVNADFIATDLGRANSADEIITKLHKKNYQIDFLVNNAGCNVYGEFAQTSWEKELNMLQLNLVSLTALTKALLPHMLHKGYGKILNIGSTGSFVPGPLNAVYCATKAYVLSFSEAIAEELNGTGVTCTVLCPGATKTEFANRAGMENVKLFKFPCAVMDASVVAKVGYDALVKGKRQITSGFSNKLLVLSTRLTPRIVTAKLTKLLMSQ